MIVGFVCRSCGSSFEVESKVLKTASEGTPYVQSTYLVRVLLGKACLSKRKSAIDGNIGCPK